MLPVKASATNYCRKKLEGWQLETLSALIVYAAPKKDIEDVYKFYVFYKTLILQHL